MRHAQFENVSSWIKDGMECLFDEDKPHFATWLWVYNEDYDGHSMTTVRPEKPEAVPLYYAARFGFRGLAEHLLAEHPEDAGAKGGDYETPLYVALIQGHIGVSLLLIQQGVDVNSRDRHDWTLLHSASRGGLAEIVEWLLKHGGSVNAQSVSGSTPLHFAASSGRLEVSRVLIEHNAEINAQTGYGSTPLHDASRRGKTEIVRLLLEHGAKVDLRDEGGRTAFEVASGPRRQEVLQLLSAHGASSAQ
jgi:26S proteasome non-ATPase regulatory subunit 10